MQTRYVITAIKEDGMRHLATNNNHLNTYATEVEAQTQLDNMIKNNDPETLQKLCGTKLRVVPVECYDSGDSTRTVFGYDLPFDILKWTPYATYEVVERDILRSEELHEDCDLVYIYSSNQLPITFWIQRLFDKGNETYKFYTIAEKFCCVGNFKKCVKWLEQNS